MGEVSYTLFPLGHSSVYSDDEPVEQPHDMDRFARRAVRNLMTAARTVGDGDCVRFLERRDANQAPPWPSIYRSAALRNRNPRHARQLVSTRRGEASGIDFRISRTGLIASKAL